MRKKIIEMIPENEAEQLRKMAAKISQAGKQDVTADEVVFATVTALVESDLNIDGITSREALRELIIDRLQLSANIIR
jgi:hypothetical protein